MRSSLACWAGARCRAIGLAGAAVPPRHAPPRRWLRRVAAARGECDGGWILRPPRLPRLPADGAAGLIFVPGLGVPAEAYRPLLALLQRRAAERRLALHVGLLRLDGAATPLTGPDELLPLIAVVAECLAAKGLDLNSPIFHGAHHSLSTMFLQDYLQARSTAGQVLLGGNLLRKHCYPLFKYRHPTLTVVAELGGYELALRYAEQFRIHHELDQALFPMVVLQGQTDVQFASGALSPDEPKGRPPAVTLGEALVRTADVVADFMCARLGLAGVQGSLADAIHESRRMLLPMHPAMPLPDVLKPGRTLCL